MIRTSYLVLFIVLIAAGLAVFFIYSSSIEQSSSGDLAELSSGLSDYLDSSDKKIRAYTTENQYANTIREECGNDEYCIVESLQKLSREQSSEIVLDTSSDLVLGYKKNNIVCHNQGHHIGEFLYGQIGDLKEAILKVDTTCGGSLYHGILESYMRSEIFFEDLTPADISINNICDDLDDLNIQIRTECHHGLGHALAIVYDFDVVSAAKRCDEFENEVEKRFCHEGVFMENTQEIMHNTDGTLDTNDILNPCNRLDEQYVRSCYYHHASYILDKTGFADDSFKVCDGIEQEIGVRACYLGLGRQLSAGFFDNMEELESVCKLGDKTYQQDCYAGSLLAILDDLGTDEGFETCKAYPEEEKQRCYAIMGKWVATVYSTQEERNNHCSKVESPKFYDLCISQVADT